MGAADSAGGVMYGYMAAAVIFVLALAGTGWKAYQLGGDRKQVEWDKANVAAAAAVEQDRKSQEQKARKAASMLQARLQTQKLASQQIADALNRELAKTPIAPDCVIPDGVREQWNRANRGENPPTGSLPSPGQPAPGTAKPVH